MEIKYRQKNLTSEEKVQIVTDYNAGIPVSEICKRYEISHMTVYRTLKTMVEKEDSPNAK